MNPDPMIIPRLYKLQKQNGYLQPQQLKDLAIELGVDLYRIQSLVTFFPHFRLTPPPKVQVDICRDMSCHLNGSRKTIESVSNWAEKTHGEKVNVCGVSCLGRCDRPVAMMINEKLFVQRSSQDIAGIVNALVADEEVIHDSDIPLAETKIGKWQMDVYDGTEGSYDAVQKYLDAPDPVTIFGEEKRDGRDGALTVAGLLGMGGAGGRAYKKWRDVFEADGDDKHVVCNADESEPGTFKDREILLAMPHLTIEGMILGGLVVGASRGWVYIRHEYHEQVEAIRAEIKRARQLGALGRNIFGSSRSFDLDVFVSPGGYICGEQTALIEAMEDKRAEPRNRPPELMTNGFRNQPTLLNNVETFAWVPSILLRSLGEWYKTQGRKTGPLVGKSGNKINGRRLFSISGNVAKPGVYEVPTGITLGELIDEHAGGMKAGKRLIAAALSGPSGGLLPAKIAVEHLNSRFVKEFIPPNETHIELRDIPLDINVSRQLGIMIGAGMVMYGTGTDILSETIACSQFFRNETCGKCVPCRIGSTKITEFGEGIADGTVSSGDLAILRGTVAELGQVMRETSICGLGKVASNPMTGFLKHFSRDGESS